MLKFQAPLKAALRSSFPPFLTLAICDSGKAKITVCYYILETLQVHEMAPKISSKHWEAFKWVTLKDNPDRRLSINERIYAGACVA